MLSSSLLCAGWCHYYIIHVIISGFRIDHILFLAILFPVGSNLGSSFVFVLNTFRMLHVFSSGNVVLSKELRWFNEYTLILTQSFILSSSHLLILLQSPSFFPSANLSFFNSVTFIYFLQSVSHLFPCYPFYLLSFLYFHGPPHTPCYLFLVTILSSQFPLRPRSSSSHAMHLFPCYPLFYQLCFSYCHGPPFLKPCTVFTFFPFPSTSLAIEMRRLWLVLRVRPDVLPDVTRHHWGIEPSRLGS